MTDDTVGNDMPRTITAETPPLTSETVSKMRLYAVDYELAVKTQEQAQAMFRQLTIQEILREAVHAGLPAVVKRYAAAVAAAKKADAA